MERFAFLTHPLSEKGLNTAFPWTKYLPNFLSRSVINRIPLLKSMETSLDFCDSQPLAGCLIVSSTAAHDLSTVPKSLIERVVLRAGSWARKSGAAFFGLGLYMSLGRGLSKEIEKRWSIPVVTGEAFSLAAAIEGLRFASQYQGVDLSGSTAVVIGASEPVGAVFAELLARETRSICLLGNDKTNLARTANRIYYDTGTVAVVSENMPEALSSAQVVVIDPYYGNLPGMPEYLGKDTIVCDVSSERFILHQIAGARKDIMLIEGGTVEFPKECQSVLTDQLMDINPSLGETLIMAIEGKGRPLIKGKELDTLKADRILKSAKKYGFRVSGFRRFSVN